MLPRASLVAARLRAASLCPRRARRNMATVAVGVSGGVDSSVAALLMKQEGHDVIGVHMTNWDSAEEGAPQESCVEQEARDARRVCDELGIGFHRVSFVREYWHSVFEPFLQGYDEGGTPNPDVSCNQHIKFDLFHEHARGLGADYVATGHYARLSAAADGEVQLLTGLDPTKDQTYFLAAVRQEALRRSRFPLGALHKSEVRRLAAEAGLHTAHKRDSTGICFIGKRRFDDFLSEYLPQQPGDFVCIESGRVVGQHRGYALYTPGQRARLGGSPARYYVVDKDIESNVVRVAKGADHPALFTRSLLASSVSWVAGVLPPPLASGERMRCAARHRYPSDAAGFDCTVEMADATTLRVWFDQPVSQVAALQIVAFYDGEVCLGGAVIQSREQSHWDEAAGLQHAGWGTNLMHLRG